MTDIKGIVMPIVTPFKEDGELDESMGCELAVARCNARRFG